MVLRVHLVSQLVLSEKKTRMLGKYVRNPLPAGMYWNNLPAGDMVRVCIEGFLANGDLPIPPLRPVREYATHASATRRAFQMDFPAGAIVPKPSSKHKPNVDQPSLPPYSSGTKRTLLSNHDIPNLYHFFAYFCFIQKFETSLLLIVCSAPRAMGLDCKQ